MTISSAEVLARISRLYVTQPGIDRWSIRVKQVSARTYKVTLRLRSSGQAGPVHFKVSGRDTKGGSQSTTITLPLH